MSSRESFCDNPPLSPPCEHHFSDAFRVHTSCLADVRSTSTSHLQCDLKGNLDTQSTPLHYLAELTGAKLVIKSAFDVDRLGISMGMNPSGSKVPERRSRTRFELPAQVSALCHGL